MDEEELYERYKTDLTICLSQILGWSNVQIAEEIESIDEMLNLSDDRYRALSVGLLNEVHCTDSSIVSCARRYLIFI